MRKVLSAEMAMQRAIDLSRRGLGKTYPNPIVGAVITTSLGEVISEGFHEGSDHAEVVAIMAARQLEPGCTIYISLEPCNHQGKTSACTEAIIAAGISKVVYAIADPNPVAAGGANKLRASGITVESGLLAEKAAIVNRDWLTKIEKSRPRIIWKIASTMDGKVAAVDGSSKWITSDVARRDVALLRSQSDAIITGSATVIADNPSLTSKGLGKNPVRIVMGEQELPNDSQIFSDDAETITVQNRNLPELMSLLTERGFNRLLIEAGPTFGTAFLKAGLVDEVILYQAPTLLGAGLNSIADMGISNLSGRLDFTIHESELVGNDLKSTLFLKEFKEESTGEFIKEAR